MKKILFAAALLLCFSCAQAQEQINWLDETKVTWEEALKVSEKEGKPLFVYVWTSWCGPCKTLKSKIFTHPEVIEYLNENFVCLNFDAESSDHWYDVGYKLHATSYPTLVMVDPRTGRVIHELSLGLFQPDVDGKSAAVGQLIELGDLVRDFTAGSVDGFFTPERFALLKSLGMSVDTEMYKAFVTQKDKLSEKYGDGDVRRMVRGPIGSAAVNNVYGLKGKKVVDTALNDVIRQYAHLLNDEERRHTLDNLDKQDNK